MPDEIRIVLLRHGEAERQAARDDLRRLTPRGREEARAVALSMRNAGVLPTLAYSSPYARACETADVIAAELAITRAGICPGVTPDDSPRRAVMQIDKVLRAGGLPLVVTHMPLIGALIALLVEGAAGAGPGVGTASGVVLTGDVCAAGQLRIAGWLTPGIS